MDADPGDPRFGSLVRCQCQGDTRQRELARLVETSGLTAAMARDLTFGTFNPHGHPSLGSAVRIASRFVEHPEGWIYVHGGYGCGKTHLLSAITFALLTRGVGAHYQVVPELLDRIRRTFDREERDESFARLWERFQTCPVLLLDDLGAEYPTPWVVERLYALVDYRYRAGAPTVFASNLPPKDLGGRIGSRIRDVQLTTVVGVAATDYRERRR